MDNIVQFLAPVTQPTGQAATGTKKMTHLGYRRDIDGLRSIAVMSVVLFHSGFQVLSGGFLGVDIFFVISGYLISAGLFKEGEAGKISIARFYERRVRRIVPAYGVVVVATLIASASILLPSTYAELGESAVAASLFVANIHFWKGAGYFAGAPISYPLLHMWSLAVEEQFYVVWPLALLLLYKFKLQRWRTALIVAGILATLLATELMLGYSPKTAFYMAPLRAWELLIGALLAAMRWPKLPSAASAHAIAGLGLILLVMPMFMLTESSRFPGLSALPSCLGSAFIIYRDEKYESFVAKLLSAKIPVFLGLISYSLYLWHWPILSLVWHMTGRDPEPIQRIALIIAMIAVATVSWRYIESPFRQRGSRLVSQATWVSRILRSTQNVLLLGGFVLLSVGGFAATIAVSRGLPQRVPEIAAEIDATRRSSYRSRNGCVFQDNVPADFLSRCFSKADFISGRKVVLWGDSYAAQHIQTIEDALKKVGFPVVAVVATGCTPLPGAVQYFGLGRADERCNNFNAQILRALASRRDIEHVIIAGRWSNLYGLPTPSGTFDPTARFLQDEAERGRNIATSLGVMARALDRTASELNAHAIPVTFLLEPPKYSTNARICVAKAIWQRSSLNTCSMREKEVRSLRQPITAVFEAFASRHGNVTVFDPLPSLCSGGVCAPYQNGELLTEDNGHLTSEGSRKALERFGLLKEGAR